MNQSLAYLASLASVIRMALAPAPATDGAPATRRKLKPSRAALKRKAMRGGFRIPFDTRITGRAR